MFYQVINDNQHVEIFTSLVQIVLEDSYTFDSDV